MRVQIVQMATIYQMEAAYLNYLNAHKLTFISARFALEQPAAVVSKVILY